MSDIKISTEKQENINNLEPKKQFRRVALLVGYIGTNYHGVQIQNKQNIKTIEGELFKALADSGAVKEQNCFDTRKMSFQRCSRTDKHVSAIRQVFSLKMLCDSTIIEEINKFLPSEIRVFGLRKVTKKFDCKRCCTSRMYEYTIPSYAYADSLENTFTEFRIDDIKKQKLTQLIHMYKGTRDFYNFTSKRPNDIKPLKRYILDFSVLIYNSLYFTF
uniref:tRNA pseudouridine synthase 1 (Trinotate prediction) n=1 Tax=Henneguya salminicola TaxID=69463 RepID=A0A6G3MEZ2_HENSL